MVKHGLKYGEFRGQMKRKEAKQVSPTEKEFCRKYTQGALEGLSMEQAAEEAFRECPVRGAKSGMEALALGHISTEIRRLRGQDSPASLIKRAKLSKEDSLEIIADIAMDEGMRPGDRLKAVELDAKIQGYLAPQASVNVNVEVEKRHAKDMSDQELLDFLAETRAKGEISGAGSAIIDTEYEEVPSTEKEEPQ